MTGEQGIPDTPAFSVVRGRASDEELAALAVLLTALRRSRGPPPPPPTRAAAGGGAGHRPPMGQGFIPGREAWRSTFRR